MDNREPGDRPDLLFYSESFLTKTNIDKKSKKHSENLRSALPYQSSLRKTKTEKCAPYLPKVIAPKHDSILESAQKWVKFPGRLDMLFPLKTVPALTGTTHGIPLEVYADRHRRYCSLVKLSDYFQDRGIEKWMLLPFEIMEKLLSAVADPPAMFHRESLFPLEWFDSVEAEIMSPSDWLALGDYQNIRYPIPGRAFIPKMRGYAEYKTDSKKIINFSDIPLPRRPVFDSIKNDLFSWKYCAVKSYEEHTGKWIVTDLDNGLTFRIPRIYFKFIAEEIPLFVDRVIDALQMRAQQENIMKYELLVDVLTLMNKDEMQKHTVKKILALAQANLKFKSADSFVIDLQAEVNMSYQRVQTSYEFRAYLAKKPEYFPCVTFPKEVIPVIKMPTKYEGKSDFLKIRQFWRKITLFYINASINGMQKVVASCINLEAMRLFTTTIGKYKHLHEFLDIEIHHYKNLVKYIKGFWLENISGELIISLRSIGKGWLDIRTKDWFVYFMAKMSRFMTQVRFRMLDSLLFFMEYSIKQYNTFLGAPCQGMVGGVTDDYVWTENLKTYPFKQTAPPIFYMLLHLREDCAFYSTTPEEFPIVLSKILDDGCNETNGIRHIDADVMQKLNFPSNLFFPLVEILRPMIKKYRAIIEDTYKMAIIPLKAYAVKYEEYIPLYMTNVTEFIVEFAAANKTSVEVKEEILLHKRLRHNMEIVMPTFIVIGPFYINIDPLRNILIERRKELVRRLLEYFVDRMQTTTEDLVEQLSSIMGRLTEKASSIERLLELEEYMLTIPSLLEVLEDRVRITVLEYETLDYFFYNLTNEHFGLKWEMIGWPFRIISQIPVTYENHKVEIEEFKKIHVSEMVTYEMRLESINEAINKFSLEFDPNKSAELSVEAKVTWKAIGELRKLAQLLQSRQAIFDLPEFTLDILDAYTQAFAPYNYLWVTIADFIKLEELTYGNPMQMLDLDDLWKTLNTMIKTLQKSEEDFVEKPEIKAIATHYLEMIEEYKPNLEIIGCLKDENWMLMHWQELSKTAGIDIKFSVNINFAYCIKKGILEHFDIVREISSRAVYEAEAIRKAMEEEERLRKEAELQLLAKRTQRKGRSDI